MAQPNGRISFLMWGLGAAFTLILTIMTFVLNAFADDHRKFDKGIQVNRDVITRNDQRSQYNEKAIGEINENFALLRKDIQELTNAVIEQRTREEERRRNE